MMTSRMFTCSGRFTTYAVVSATSSAVSARTPNLAALYTFPIGYVMCPAVEPMFTTCPRRRATMCGRIARVTLSRPFRFVSIMRSQSSGSPSWILESPLASPALLMRTSGTPPVATRSAAARFTSARSRTSTRASRTATRCRCSSSAASRSSRSRRRAHSTSAAPSPARRRAHASPIPELAPVTNMSLPLIRFMGYDAPRVPADGGAPTGCSAESVRELAALDHGLAVNRHGSVLDRKTKSEVAGRAVISSKELIVADGQVHDPRNASPAVVGRVPFFVNSQAGIEADGKPADHVGRPARVGHELGQARYAPRGLQVFHLPVLALEADAGHGQESA